MSRHEIKVEETIAASPAKVYAVISDPKRLATWLPNVEAVRSTNSKTGLGATRTVSMRVHNTLVESHQRIVTAETNSQYGWVHDQDLVDGEPFGMIEDVGTQFALSPKGKGTHVVATAHFAPKGFKAKLAVPLVSHDVKKQMHTALENLKRLAEAK